MRKIKLGVNIDHVGTVRNARGESYPDPLRAAILAQKSGADSVTIHLREDRRHIRDKDLKNIIKKLKIPINLEIAATSEMLNIVFKYKPNSVCIVPEKRQELTTEGGLNLKFNFSFLYKMINKIKKKKIKVSLFIEPKRSDVILAKKLNVDCVEFHTGKICRIINKNKNFKYQFKNLLKNSEKATNLGLIVHAGHGINYKSALILSKNKYIKEFNVGHFIIGESIFLGLRTVIKNFKSILKK